MNRSVVTSRRAARGFTLVELMAVVAITGILGALALATLRQRAFASDVTSAKVVVRSIAAAEEHYRAENQVYLNVSSPGDSWYPRMTLPNNKKVNFWAAATNTETANWRLLAPDIRQPVSFGYKANAGLPPTDGVTTPRFDYELSNIAVLQSSVVEPWYMIQARVDADGNGIGCMVGAASWTPEVFSINDGE
jgi:prepilin-type N-terminal cleavage/methylation domain-containing protein